MAPGLLEPMIHALWCHCRPLSTQIDIYMFMNIIVLIKARGTEVLER